MSCLAPADRQVFLQHFTQKKASMADRAGTFNSWRMLTLAAVFLVCVASLNPTSAQCTDPDADPPTFTGPSSTSGGSTTLDPVKVKCNGKCRGPKPPVQLPALGVHWSTCRNMQHRLHACALLGDCNDATCLQVVILFMQATHRDVSLMLFCSLHCQCSIHCQCRFDLAQCFRQLVSACLHS
jgi:hypothetical protein